MMVKLTALAFLLRLLTWGSISLASSILLGPSAGHWYADRTGRGWSSFGLRLGLSFIGFFLLYGLANQG